MIEFAAVTATQISGILAGSAALIASILAFIKFGLGEKGSLTITQAQGANTILDAALKSLNKELERKDEIIDEVRAERDKLRKERDNLKEQLERRPYQIGDS